MTGANIYLPSGKMITVRHDGYLFEPGVGYCLPQIAAKLGPYRGVAWEQELLAELDKEGLGGFFTDENWCSDYEYLIEAEEGDEAELFLIQTWYSPSRGIVFDKVLPLEEAVSLEEERKVIPWHVMPEEIRKEQEEQREANEKKPVAPHNYAIGTKVKLNSGDHTAENIGHTIDKKADGTRVPTYLIRHEDGYEENYRLEDELTPIA